jgi:hypothetical protein
MRVSVHWNQFIPRQVSQAFVDDGPVLNQSLDLIVPIRR